MMSEKIKVAILGSDTYENTKKIKNHIYLWKQDFGDNLTIVGGGGKYGPYENAPGPGGYGGGAEGARFTADGTISGAFYGDAGGS